EAFNADEAVAILKSGACIDLIFTDVRMPGAMDGLGLLAYAQLGQPRIPVLVSSGHRARDRLCGRRRRFPAEALRP
ncbi:MAG: response regulator transcription factor, partial [Brevundimonas mediterranea]